ncbi:sugar ABC transporter substrate-binding protein [Glaciimonas sp. GNP009]
MSTEFSRRRFGQVLLGATAVLTCSGVFGAVASSGKKIAIMPKTLINDVFQIKIVEAAERAAAKLGIPTERFGSRNDVAILDQINTIEALIARGEFGGIVLAPVVERGLGNVLRKAKQAGIFVVLVDSKTDGDAYVTLIDGDNLRASGAAADYGAKLIAGKGKAAMLEGEPGGSTAAQRTQGFHESLKKYPGIQLVSSITGHWTLPGGVQATEGIIAAHPDLDLIFAASDMMGIGARQVLDRAAKKAEASGNAVQAKKFSDVKIVGFDGVAEAVRQIWAGKMSATISVYPDVMGGKAVEILGQLMKGEKQPSDFSKHIDAGLIVVTPLNVDAFAKANGIQKG